MITKTIMDAVNEFKGVLDENIIFESITNEHYWPKGKMVSDDTNHDTTKFSPVCTRAEFYAVVKECSNNFGLTSVTAVDWSKAPVGATHHSKGNEFYGECWYKDVSDKSFFCMPVSAMDWVLSFDTWQISKRKLTPKPQPTTPVYTQEMADNGRIIESGMLFATNTGEYIAEYTNKNSICFTDENGFLVTITRGYAKPIDNRTDEDKAIDDLVARFGMQRSAAKVALVDIKVGKIHGVKWVGE